MKTLLKLQDIWDLVEREFANPDEEKDTKPLIFIQHSVHE